MNRTVFFLAAIGVHIGVLFGVKFPTSATTLPLSPEKKYIEVTLVQPPLPEPPKPTPPPLPELPPSPPLPPPPPPPVARLLSPQPKLQPPPPEPSPQVLPEHTPAPPPSLPTPSASVPASTLPATPTAVSVPVASPPNPYLDITQPSYTSQIEPEYPRLAQRMHQQGTVTLTLYINTLGTLDKIAVAQSSGFPMLDAAAEEAMRESHFHPAYQGSTPVPSRAQVSITFRLE